MAQPDLPAATAIYTVTTLNDVTDANDGALSLREALALANADPDHSEIRFDPSLAGGIVKLSGSPLEISSMVTVNGDTNGDGAADITVSGNFQSRVFEISAGPAVLHSLTIQHGVSDGGSGVAIDRDVDVIISHSTIQQNLASGTTTASGGGIMNAGNLYINDSTIAGNGATVFGGGIANFGSVLSLENTTVANNSGASGGGIASFLGFTVTGSTIAGNSASGTGGGVFFIFASNTSLEVTDSIISGNSASVTGANIDDANIAGVNASNSLIDQDPAAIFEDGTTVADFGGTVPTIAVLDSITAGATPADYEAGGDNTAPVATDDTASTQYVTSVLVNVLSNDSDADGDALSLDSVTNGANGSAAVENGQIRYTPNDGFIGTDNLTYTISDGNGGTDTASLAVSVSAPASLYRWFLGNSNITEDITGWDVSAVTNANSMFYGATAFNQDIGSWDVSSVTDMSMMLWDATAFNQDISGWDVSSVTNMYQMFSNAEVFNQDISDWDVSGVMDMGGMFSHAYTFNQNIGDWDVSGVTNMDYMFYHATSFDQNLGDWDISNVTSMVGLFDDSGMWVDNYDATLNGWYAQVQAGASLQTGVTIGAKGVPYSEASAEARAALAEQFGWSFEGDFLLNASPDASDDSASTTANAAVNIDVLDNDSDPDGDVLQIINVTQGSNGTVVVDTKGTFYNDDDEIIYTPYPSFSGTDTFTYTISDPAGGSDTATVTVTVNPVNADPVASNDSATIAYNTATLIDVLSNDSDADGDALTLSGTTDGANGSVVIVGGQVQYAPNPGFSGTDTFTYTVSDGNGGTDTASVTVTVAPDESVDPANSLIISEYVEGSGASQAIELYNPTDGALDLSAFTLEIYSDGSDAATQTIAIPAGTIAAGGTFVITNSGADAALLERADLSTAALSFNGNDALVLRQGGVIVDSFGQAGVDPGTAWAETVESSNNAQGFLDSENHTLRRVLSVEAGDTDPFDAFTLQGQWNGFESDTFDGLGHHFTVATSLEPTPEEQLILQLINAARENPLGHMNEMFSTGQSNIDGSINFFGVVQATAVSQVAAIASMAPLAWNAELASSAETHNNLLLQYDTQSHHLPDEPGLGQRILDAGYDFGSVGENVFSYAQDPLYAHAGFYIDWGYGPDGIQDPPGHRDAILNSSFTEIGIAYQPNLGVDDEQATGPIAVTEHLARSLSAGNPQIVGVVIDDQDEDDFYDIGEGLGGITVTAVGGGQSFSTTTWASGGYALEVAPNVSYTVTFSGGALSEDQTFTVAVGTSNVTQDAELGGDVIENTAPVAADDVASTQYMTSVLVNVLSNDSDADGDALSLDAVTDGANGTTVIQSGQIRYTPNDRFIGTDNLTYTISDGNGGSDTASVAVSVSAPASLDRWFLYVRDVTEDVTGWDVSGTTSMEQTFRGTFYFDQDIGSWDVSSVTNMGHMFSQNPVFNQAIGNWDVSSVTDMGGMFAETDAFNQAIGDWDVSNVTNMGYMFSHNPVFNQAIGNWDVSSVTDMGGMFNGADAFNQAIGNWDVSSVTDMSGMFTDADAFNQAIGDWDVSNVTDMYGMFSHNPAFNQAIGDWDVSSVTDMRTMFLLATAFDQDIGGWDVSNVTTMVNMFLLAEAFNQDIGGWDVSNVTNMGAMFSDATSFDQDLGDWDISNVSNMTSMFDNSGMSTANYDATLNGWYAQVQAGASLQSGVTIGVEGLTFSAASAEARAALAEQFGWAFDGDALENTGPDASDDSASTTAGTAINIDVLDNDTDPDGDALEITGVTQGSNGTVAIDTKGTADTDDDEITYTPDAGTSGTDTFTYTVSDGNGGTDTASVTVNVGAAQNTAPVAADDVASTEHMTSVLVNVLDNDSDADGDALTIIDVSESAEDGMITQTDDGQLEYTPDTGFIGTDSFTYTISDGNGGTDTATVSITVTAPENAAPVAVTDVESVAEDSFVLVRVLSNDSDADGDALSITGLLDGPANGTAVIENGQIRYTPNANFNGTDQFIYTVSDGDLSDSGIVNITVTPVNDAPDAAGDSASTGFETPVLVDVLGNDTDVDAGDSLVIFGFTDGANGTVTEVEGQLQYDPNPGFSGTDTFTYTVRDGNGGTDTASVSVTVGAAQNTAPVAADDVASVAEDSAVVVDVLSNDQDADGDGLRISGVGDPANGTVVIEEGQIRYTPNADFNGTDLFTYTITDGQESSTASVSVRVSPVNDAPTVSAVVRDIIDLEFDPSTPVDLLHGAFDVDGDPLSIDNVEIISGNGDDLYIEEGDGWLSVSNLDYAYLAAGEVEEITLRYDVVDGNGGSTSQTAVISIAGVNDIPDVLGDQAETDQNTAVDIDVLANDTDPDGDRLEVYLQSSPTFETENGGIVTVNEDGATLNYDPNGAFDYLGAGQSATDSFYYNVSDGMEIYPAIGDVTVTITGTNDAPDAAGDSASTGFETPVLVDVLGNDTDVDAGDNLEIATFTQGSSGTVTEVEGQLQYDPNPGFSGTDTFTYTVSDGNGGTDTASVSVTVGAAQNTAPVATDDTASVAEDSSVVVNVLSNDRDADGDSLRISGVGDPANGTVVIEEGQIRYTPNANFNGTDLFTYTITDGQESRTASVSVTVDPVNDAPVAPEMHIQSDEDTWYYGRIEASDVEGDALTYSLVSVHAPHYLDVTVNPDGTFSFLPMLDFWSSADGFTYEVSDGNGGTAQGRVSVYIEPVNDAPDAVTDSATTAFGAPVLVDVLANDTDVDASDNLEIATFTHGYNGTVEKVGGQLQYTPNAGFSGSDFFLYVVQDGQGGADTTTVAVTVNPPANTAPVALDDTANVAEDRSVLVDVLSNDSDPENNELRLVAVSEAENGIVTIEEGQILYTPDADFSGTESISYRISDGEFTDTATVTITVDSVNDAPSFAIGQAAGESGQTIEFDGLTRFRSTGTGSVPVDYEGFRWSQFSFIDMAAFEDTFGTRYGYSQAEMSGGSGIGLIGGASHASIQGRDFSLTSGWFTLGNMLSTSSETRELVATAYDDGLEIGSVTLSLDAQQASFVSFDSAIFGNVDEVVFTSVQGNGFAVDNLVLNGPDPSAYDFEAFENGDPLQVDLALYADDVDGDDDASTLSYEITGAPAGGTAELNGTVLSFDPGTDFRDLPQYQTETVTVQVTVTDSHGASVARDIAIIVYPDNTAPVAQDDTAETEFDTPVVVNVLGNDTDVDVDELHLTAVEDVSGGTVEITVDNQVLFTPTPGFSGTASFTYWVSDGSTEREATATVTVAASTVLTASPDSAELQEDSMVLIDVLANDGNPGNLPLTITDIGGAVNGTAELENGQLRYTPNANFNGSETLTYTVSNGVTSSSASVAVEVTPVNDPIALSEPVLLSISEDDGYTQINLLSGATDVDGQALQVSDVEMIGATSAIQSVSGATLSLFPSVYDFLDTGEVAVLSLNYQISDGAGSSVMQYADIVIEGVNDAPVGHDDTASTEQGQAVTIDVLANDTDVDEELLQVLSASNGRNGTTQVLNDGSIVYTPDAGFAGPDSFTYEVSDGDASHSATVYVDVSAPDNSAPVAHDDRAIGFADAPIRFNVFGNDLDAEGDTLTLVDFEFTGIGTLTYGGGGNFTYDTGGALATLPQGESALQSFSYRVTDGQFTASAEVDITISGTYEVSNGNMIYEGEGPTLRGTSGSEDIFVFDIDPTNPLTDMDAIAGFEAGLDEIWLPTEDYGVNVWAPGQYALVTMGNGDMIFVAGRIFSPDDLNISVTTDEFGF